MPNAILLSLVLAAEALGGVASPPPGMRLVPAGEILLPFRRDTVEIKLVVDSFFLDQNEVTQGEFLNFIRENRRFARSRFSRLFSDDGYLRRWKSDSEPPTRNLDAPVTEISWHAAKEYCACKGKRLPTTAEWERAAWALPPGTDSSAFRQTILTWYSQSDGASPPKAGSGTVNAYGVHDLFGVSWEWTSDFNAYGFAGLNKRGVEDSALFCGGGTTRASRSADYATYMRWAFRSSLKPSYAVGTLGFRCARSAAKKGA